MSNNNIANLTSTRGAMESQKLFNNNGRITSMKPMKDFGKKLGRQYEQRINNLFKEENPKNNKIYQMVSEMEKSDK